MSMVNDGIDNFNNLSQKFSQLLYGRTEGDCSRISKSLDELNNLDYNQTIVFNTTKAVLLINQCCTLVPPDDAFLVPKCCCLITNLINRQNIPVEGRTLSLALEWCFQALKQDNSLVDVLLTVEALITSNSENLHLLLGGILVSTNPLFQLAANEDLPDIVLLSIQCLEACTRVPDLFKKQPCNENKSILKFDLCSEVFLKYLINERCEKFSDDILYSKLLISCLRGLQNIASKNQDFLTDKLGILLGITKSYMVYSIKNVNFILPQKLMPSLLSIPEATVALPREKKGGKIAKQRKHRMSANKKDAKKCTEWTNETYNYSGYVPASGALSLDNQLNTSITNYLKTSDSDFSDTEGGKLAKTGILQGRVRQAALNLLLDIAKCTEKRTMFSFWSSFLSDGSFTNAHILTTCILKDPSPRGRMAALNVLLTLLTNSKLYLCHAENSDRVSSFTSFSIVLGNMITELHRCLILALNESSIPVLTQALKCLAVLVQATPYHRLSTGLVSKLIRNVKVYAYHRDATVQVAALIVLGCLLSSEPVIPETVAAFLKFTSNVHLKNTTSDNGLLKETNDSSNENDETNSIEDLSDYDDEISNDYCTCDIPWLLQKCLNNLGVPLEDGKAESVVAAPVKLESLQVMSAMSRNYFGTLMAPHILLIAKSLNISLCDKYTDLRLHAGRTIDFIGQAMKIYYNSDEMNKKMSLENGVVFWQTLMNSSLISLVQNEHQSTLRAVGCDCLGSMGSYIYENLPRDKQILTITLLFACTRDEENSVKGAAIRALGICILYSSLREDAGFVFDTAESIHRLLQDENMTVRIKASWSLGNLSDALVLNRSDQNVIEDIPDSLLLKLLQESIRGCSDNDKIRMNTVRALGNLLQLITSQLLDKSEFVDVTVKAMEALVNNSTTGSNMKVRWNSCYALGNVLKNQTIYACNGTWQSSVFASLCDLVIGFSNFKVRINAALALSSPPSRSLYGQHYYMIWKSLLKALENSQHIEDFKEYKHRDHLIEQICLTIGHLTTLLTIEDLSHLEDCLNFHFDCFKIHMHRVLDHMIPEKSTILYTASAFVTSLAAHEHLSLTQKNVLKLIINVFIHDIV